MAARAAIGVVRRRHRGIPWRGLLAPRASGSIGLGMPMRLAAAAAVVSAMVPLVAAGAPSVRQLLAKYFHFDRHQIDEVERRKAVSVSLPGSLDREILAAGAVRIGAPARRVLNLFRDIETLESGTGFLTTVQLSDPPRLDDFDALVLPPSDIADLRRCTPGDCELKLNQRGFDLLAQVDWRRPDADAQAQRFARQMLLSIALAYRTRGNAGLGLSMDDEPHRQIAGEFGEMLRGKPFLEHATSWLVQYMLGYPSAAGPPQLEEFLYWSLVEFGLKKTVRLNHVLMYPVAGAVPSRWVLANRIVYASHYFQNGVEVRLLVDDPADPAAAHYLFVLNMARPDGLTGVFGPLVRYKVRSGSRETLRKTMLITRDRAEAAAR